MSFCEDEGGCRLLTSDMGQVQVWSERQDLYVYPSFISQFHIVDYQ
jgi:hypothetical protein